MLGRVVARENRLMIVVGDGVHASERWSHDESVNYKPQVGCVL